jgi:hypothetical protein
VELPGSPVSLKSTAGDQCIITVGYAFGATRKPSGHGFLDFPGLFA